jgi:hypothetical protein
LIKHRGDPFELRVVLRSYPFVRDVIVTEGVVGEHVVIIVFFHLQP